MQRNRPIHTNQEFYERYKQGGVKIQLMLQLNSMGPPPKRDLLKPGFYKMKLGGLQPTPSVQQFQRYGKYISSGTKIKSGELGNLAFCQQYQPMAARWFIAWPLTFPGGARI